MRIATRLVLVLGGIVLGTVAVYMAISHQERQALLRDGMRRDTETLARALQTGATSALRQGRDADLDEILRAVVTQDEEVSASVVLDAAGEPIAGGAVDLACLRAALPAAGRAAGAARGWAECATRVYWVSLPVPPPGAALVVAQREVLLNRAVSAALRRQLLLTLLLMATVALTIVLVLRRSLSEPLAGLVRGVRALGAGDAAARIDRGAGAGELAELAGAFN
jgi:methyl-accepting chemotaxis protein